MIEDIGLDKIKVYNKKAQVKQKGAEVLTQTIDKNIEISFYSMIEAMKFTTKITDVLTGTTMSKRGVDKVKEAINTVDDVLGFDTRDIMKNVLENGLAKKYLAE